MIRILQVAAAAILMTACATPTERDTQAGRDIESALEQATAAATTPSAPPSAISDALLPPMSSRAMDAPVAEPRFDLNVENQGARGFFMGLVRGTPYNMVVHPDVDGRVSLSLKNVTIPEVMEITRDVYGYEYQRSQSGYMVLPAAVRTQVFEINYLNVRRSGTSRTRVSSGQASDSTQQMMPGAGGIGGLNQASQFGQGQGQQQQSGSSVETESESDFWPLLQSTLEAIVGTGAGRGVIINAQTGTLVVRAMPSELREVSRYLATVQASAQRMVILEAKVIEVELRDGFESGINWRAIARSGATRTVTGGVLRGADLFNEGTSPLAGRTIPISSGDPVPNLDGEGFGGVFGVGIDTRDFDAFIELLETQGRTQVLSSPRVTAINNQKSVIKVGSDEFFVTNIAAQTTVGTASSTASSVQLTPFFSGIALDVTPQISANGEVILHIQPTVSEVRDQTKVLPVSGGQQPVAVPLAFSSVRQSDSIVRARSGQVIVIGGLMRSQSRDQTAGVPVAGLLPGIGGLFRSTRQREVMSELVILLRPIVVDDSEWVDQIREQDERLRAMSGTRR
ncbi:MAG: pilus (MSHA type) biogenesis protein MshL [Xanthomonadaceae bacterium]|nr:pilus (MSHA type) biogenesis protein MshL [Xanthomonadaceae bacterium]